MDGFNFIKSSGKQNVRSAKRRTGRSGGIKLYVGIVFATVFILLLIVTVLGIGKFISGVETGQESLDRAQESALEFDIVSAGSHLEEARVGFESARSGLKLLGWMRVLPWAGNQLEALEAAMDAGVEALFALEEATDIAEDVADVIIEAQNILEEADVPEDEYTFERFPEEMKERLLTVFKQQHIRLVEMQLRLEFSQESLDELEEMRGVSPKILNAVNPFRELLPNLIAGVDLLVPLSASVDELAGVGDEKQWLMLFLNNTEMRPAGGFMGVYGLMTLLDAEVQGMNVADSYSVDRQVEGLEEFVSPVPAPLEVYTGVDKWYFRDANWSPDFSVSAIDAARLLQEETGLTGQPASQIDGVIGFTPTFAEDLIEAIGPITVEGMEFTHENVTELLEFEVEFGYEDKGINFDERKVIVGKLTDAVLNELYALPISRWGELFQIIQSNIQEKQVAFYSFDPATQNVFNDAGWGATVNSIGYDDYLLVVDANMHALKTDASIERTIDYTIEKNGGDYIATTTINYIHFGSYDLFTSKYRTFTRVYAPQGSELISVNGESVTVEDDLGLVSFGAFIEIEPGSNAELVFKYKLAESVQESVDAGVYQLLVMKQMGADNYALTLDLDFGKKVRAARPSEDSMFFGDTKYSLNTILVHDLDITVQF